MSRTRRQLTPVPSVSDVVSTADADDDDPTMPFVHDDHHRVHEEDVYDGLSDDEGGLELRAPPVVTIPPPSCGPAAALLDVEDIQDEDDDEATITPLPTIRMNIPSLSTIIASILPIPILEPEGQDQRQPSHALQQPLDVTTTTTVTVRVNNPYAGASYYTRPSDFEEYYTDHLLMNEANNDDDEYCENDDWLHAEYPEPYDNYGEDVDDDVPQLMYTTSAFYKPMCCYYKQKGFCRKGEDCWYAHYGEVDTPCHYGADCLAGHAHLAQQTTQAASSAPATFLPAPPPVYRGSTKTQLGHHRPPEFRPASFPCAYCSSDNVVLHDFPLYDGRSATPTTAVRALCRSCLRGYALTGG